MEPMAIPRESHTEIAVALYAPSPSSLFFSSVMVVIRCLCKAAKKLKGAGMPSQWDLMTWRWLQDDGGRGRDTQEIPGVRSDVLVGAPLFVVLLWIRVLWLWNGLELLMDAPGLTPSSFWKLGQMFGMTLCWWLHQCCWREKQSWNWCHCKSTHLLKHHFSTLCRHIFPLQHLRQLFGKLGTGEIIGGVFAPWFDQTGTPSAGGKWGCASAGWLLWGFSVFRSNWILSSLSFFELW